MTREMRGSREQGGQGQRRRLMCRFEWAGRVMENQYEPFLSGFVHRVRN
jgi:hypothetical protein